MTLLGRPVHLFAEQEHTPFYAAQQPTLPQYIKQAIIFSQTTKRLVSNENPAPWTIKRSSLALASLVDGPGPDARSHRQKQPAFLFPRGGQFIASPAKAMEEVIFGKPAF